jgi:nucleoside-diphosphate-sugar epimerase
VQRLVITGSSGALGQRLVFQLSEPGAPSVDEVIAIDRVPLPVTAQRPSGVRTFVRDLGSGGSDGLADLFQGADVLVHLASDGSDVAGPVSNADDKVTSRVLEAAGVAGVSHLIIVSSAVVYGAHSDNPVPLTEDAPLRPNPGFEFAAERLAMEAQATAWANAAGGRTVTILRPAVSPLATGTSGWLARAVRPSRLDQIVAPLPAMQFVHVDDVASAVIHAGTQRLNGVFNVAPDGWLSGEQVAPLLGMMLSIPATGRVHALAALLVGLIRRGRERPVGAEPWSIHPWVIANDRLKATGWNPRSTSAEVIVASRAPSALATLFARKRQEVTIIAVAVSGLGLAGSVLHVLRRRK